MWNDIEKLLGRFFRVDGVRFQLVGYSPKHNVVRLWPEGAVTAQPVPCSLFFASLWKGTIEEVP